MMLPSGSVLATGVLAGVAGLVLGAVHFGSLRWNARLFAGGAAGPAFLLQLGRLAVTVLGFCLLVHFGASALLCGAATWLCARTVVLRRVGAG